jgi:hypothetical protein
VVARRCAPARVLLAWALALFAPPLPAPSARACRISQPCLCLCSHRVRSAESFPASWARSEPPVGPPAMRAGMAAPECDSDASHGNGQPGVDLWMITVDLTSVGRCDHSGSEPVWNSHCSAAGAWCGVCEGGPQAGTGEMRARSVGGRAQAGVGVGAPLGGCRHTAGVQTRAGRGASRCGGGRAGGGKCSVHWGVKFGGGGGGSQLVPPPAPPAPPAQADRSTHVRGDIHGRHGG